MPDLLIELFSEEIPARMQAKAAQDLQRMVTNGVVEAGLTYAGARAFATPRRLTLAVSDLTEESPTRVEERRGPKVGAPDKAIEGFCRGAGVARDALITREEKKGTFYFAEVVTPGRQAEAIVAEVLEHAIRSFPWPKSMRWGAGSLRWVRPLSRILCVLTDAAGEARVVPLSIDGITAGAVTEGHRVMGGEPFSVSSFDDYVVKLKRNKVVLAAEDRAAAIRNDAENAAFARGLEVVEDEGLLQEIAGLVEWPVVLLGEIEPRFLDLPPEVLQTSMKEHQKFLSLRNPGTGRIEGFVTVANVEAPDGGATILAGNQKVLAARLSDAAFFWENDLRVAQGAGLEAWTDALANVTFHGKLGSQADRVARIAALAREIAPIVGADADLAEQAARVCKADLSSEMVYEFPELQGLMGRYYAEAAGLAPEVAAACQEHYSPLGPSDAVPSAPVSVAVALADKLDTLTGFWAIDEKPTGSKDPYALRRAALGVIRLVLGNGVRIDLINYLFSALFLAFDEITSSLQEMFDPLPNRDLLEQLARGDLSGLGKANALISRLPTAKDDLANLAEFLSIEIHAQGDFILELDLSTVSAETAEAVFGEDYKKKLKSAVSGLNLLRECMNFELLRVNNWVVDKSEKFPTFSEEALDFSQDLLAFFHDRLKVHLRDEGIPHDVIDACLAMPGSDDLVLLVKRAEALAAFRKTDDGENLVQGFKRANNILTQAQEADGVEYSYGADPKYAETEEERALFAALEAAEAEIAPAMEAEDFAAAMRAMAALRAPIDAFFEAVQVNTDNQIVRRNRLNLLGMITRVCGQVADLTRISGA